MYRNYRRLQQWREYVQKIFAAVRDVLGGSIEVYVFGGAAEDRLTALSDIDVAIVLPKEPSPRERLRIKQRVFARAVDAYGLPWDYPVEIHVVGPKGFEEIKKQSKIVFIGSLKD